MAFGRGTSSVVSFVVAMNRVDVVDLVDLDLDVDLVDVDLAVSLFDGPRLVLLSFGLVALTCFIDIWPRFVLLTFGPDLSCRLWPRLVLLLYSPELNVSRVLESLVLKKMENALVDVSNGHLELEISSIW